VEIITIKKYTSKAKKSTTNHPQNFTDKFT